jgi:hypothetical protein
MWVGQLTSRRNHAYLKKVPIPFLYVQPRPDRTPAARVRSTARRFPCVTARFIRGNQTSAVWVCFFPRVFCAVLRRFFFGRAVWGRFWCTCGTTGDEDVPVGMNVASKSTGQDAVE